LFNNKKKSKALRRLNLSNYDFVYYEYTRREQCIGSVNVCEINFKTKE